METLLSLVGTPANALTLLIAAGILVILLSEKGLLGIRIGKNEPLAHRMDKLIEYVNHRDTEKMDTLIELARETNTLLKEVSKYGIKCRDE